jgi:pregnancy-associated plasma protein-A
MRIGFVGSFRRSSAFVVALAALGLGLSASAVAAQVTQVDPVWLRKPAAGEWCWTYQEYFANLKRLAVNPLSVVCAEMGPCDNFVARDAAIPTPATPIKTYRLTIHVFCDDNGGNCAATLADVAAAVARLNADYAPWHIQFVYETDFIRNTKYRDLDISTNTEPKFMKKAYAVSPATKLNVYVVNTGGGSWGTFPWDPNALGEQGGIVMHESWFVAVTPLPSIFTHEVGHCLGLWHTFHGVTEVPQCSGCYEEAGRTPEAGDTTGDFCSETNPTTNTSACSDPPGLDPCNGQPWMSAPWLNYMGYSNSCAIEFKAQQAGRMHCWTTSVLTGWLDLPAPPTAPGTPSLTKFGGGQILVAWADNSTSEDGFRVQRETKSGGSWVNAQILATVGVNTTAMIDSPGSGTFRYRVQAFNGNGDSAWSGWSQIKN